MHSCGGSSGCAPAVKGLHQSPEAFGSNGQPTESSHLDRFTFTRNRFDRDFASTGEARFPPWACRPQGGRNAVQKARNPGLRWAKSVLQPRCGACPMHHIALRTAPYRTNRFGAIKRFRVNVKRSSWPQPQNRASSFLLRPRSVRSLGPRSIPAVRRSRPDCPRLKH